VQTAFDKSGSFVASQFTTPKGAERQGLAGPAVTISHQTGAGAHEVAERLAEILQNREPKGAQPWTVLDRQLVERALEEHHLPQKLAKKMPEDKRSYVDDVLDDLFGLRPPSWVLVPQVVETMLHLAEAGHVVLIGRGATLVTARLAKVFHVRLVAQLATRVERVHDSHHLTVEEAAKFVEKEDRGRQRYVRANFHARVDDDLLYHLVVNTDRLSFDDAAALIAEGALRFFQHGSGEPQVMRQSH
jgi:DNA-binding transcriptional ArsR family regulator